MALSFVPIDGSGFAFEAARLLEEAWKPPALRYTAAYLGWQLSFPSTVEMPSAAAFDGSVPVGFAGASARQLRHGSTTMDVAIVSFVAVRPAWRGRGVATGLYRTLLKTLADREIPVITYAIPASVGERTLLRAYPEAGFQMRALGLYSNYAFADRQEKTCDQWLAGFSDDVERLAPLAEERAAHDEAVLWSMPTRHQLTHYLVDPRPRKLIVVEHASEGTCGAAFVIHSELRMLQNTARVITLDCVWISGSAVAGLLALLRLASAAWPSPGTTIPVVMCPNLGGFDASALRAIGVRRTGAQFCGYFCSVGQKLWPAFERTNLEII